MPADTVRLLPRDVSAEGPVALPRILLPSSDDVRRAAVVGAQPLTRRQARDEERRESLAVPTAHLRGRTGSPAVRPPSGRGRQAAALSSPPRSGANRRTLASRLLTVTTMFAVGAMAVVTSVPANALLVNGVTPLGSNAVADVQRLEATAGENAVIARDGYTVQSAPKPPPPPPPAVSVAPRPLAALSAAAPAAPAAPSAPSGSILWPFPRAVPITDGFGPRVSPCAGCSTNHAGIDMDAGNGATIRAVADGVVSTVVESNSGLGVYVIIDHQIGGQLVTSTYAHMAFGSVPLRVGQTVRAGDTVGRVGNSGASAGPHLHLEIRLGGVTAVDGYAWLSRNATY